MLVKELTNFIFDKINIYVEKDGEFEDLYKGDTNGVTATINDMKVRTIGASKKGIVDIQVFNR